MDPAPAWEVERAVAAEGDMPILSTRAIVLRQTRMKVQVGHTTGKPILTLTLTLTPIPSELVEAVEQMDTPKYHKSDQAGER